MHPPVNISSNSTFASDNSMNYTIRLSHGSAFWTTVFDATGASWSSGPYHAGTNKNVGCLATLTGQDSVGGVMADSKSDSQGGIGIGALVGGIVGAFFAGLILAALAMMLLSKRKKKRSHVCIFPLSVLLCQYLHSLILSECSADHRTRTDQQNLWMVTTIPKSAPQHGDPTPTHPSPNPNQ